MEMLEEIVWQYPSQGLFLSFIKVHGKLYTIDKFDWQLAILNHSFVVIAVGILWTLSAKGFQVAKSRRRESSVVVPTLWNIVPLEVRSTHVLLA